MGNSYRRNQEQLESLQGILEVHHIHIWAISTTLNAFTAHVKVKLI